MIVFLVGEGPADIGGLSAGPPYQTTEPGFLQPIVEQVVSGTVSFKGRKLTALGKQRFRGLEEALAHKAAAGAVIAELVGAQVVVIATDLDGGSGRRNARQAERLHEQKRKAIHDGCNAVNGCGLRCVAATPCRTIEAWALGDLGSVGRIADNEPELPSGKGPEDLWGDPREDSSNHPKRVLQRVLGRPAIRDDLSTIAEHADLDLMRENCPVSFVPFCAELSSATNNAD